MADEKKAPPSTPEQKDVFADILWYAFLFFVLMSFFSSIVTFLDTKFGSLRGLSWADLSYKSLLLSGTRPIASLLNPLHSQVMVSADKTAVYQTPGGKQIATKKLGDTGKIIGGPIVYAGETYWHVRFSDGTEGWVKETDMVYVPEKRTPLAQMESVLGGPVKTNTTTDIYDKPGGTVVGTISKNTAGTIIEGPLVVDGQKYWHIRFENGRTGWVKEGDVDYMQTKRKALSESSDPMGETVAVNKKSIDVYGTPGGEKIYTQYQNVTGTVIDGPQDVSGYRYWKVQFEDGTSGWVREGDIDLVYQTPVPLSSVPSVLGGTVASTRAGAEVYARPGDTVIRTMRLGERGVILEGPLVKDGVRYYHIQFEDGTSGWVRENDLEYLEEQTLSWPKRILLFVLTLFRYAVYGLYALVAAIVFGCVYLIRRLSAVRQAERSRLYPTIEKEYVPTHPRWQKIQDHIASTNETEWRLAVLEADILLLDLLEKLQLPGDTIADKLKAVEKSDFTTLDLAWEAHKVRNRIAHDGMTFVLTQREARRVIALYQEVFTEFKLI